MPAVLPGLKVVGMDVFSTDIPSMTAFQSVLQVTFAEDDGLGDKGGKGVRYFWYSLLIFGLKVLAPTSCLSLATQAGTTLLASTWYKGTFIPSRPEDTDKVQREGARRGRKSVTRAMGLRDLACERIVSDGSPGSNVKGMLREVNSSSTSFNPPTMNSYCLVLISPNLFGIPNTTSKLTLCCLAMPWAKMRDQLSCTRWSRFIHSRTQDPVGLGDTVVVRILALVESKEGGVSESAMKLLAVLELA
mmetsp:Transcript_20208/g.42346  ORF Transcript_20208/g.42346 Transcript_20208/m.42346 type:complete len:246 (-) Transcript_20208:109-846(-)